MIKVALILVQRDVLGLGYNVSFFQPQTPTHLVEDLQDVIKQESEESAIVAGLHESGPPLLKKIKQEVNRKLTRGNLIQNSLLRKLQQCLFC